MDRNHGNAPNNKVEVMFSFLSNVTKAVVGAVVETPLAMAADAITLSGVLTDKEEPYTPALFEEDKDQSQSGKVG